MLNQREKILLKWCSRKYVKMFLAQTGTVMIINITKFFSTLWDNLGLTPSVKCTENNILHVVKRIKLVSKALKEYCLPQS